MLASVLLPALATMVALPSGPAPEAVVQDTIIRVGQFNRFDPAHWAKGRVAIFSTEEGALVLAFAEEFEAADGPDLYVVLSAHPAPRRGSDLGEYLELKPLEKTSGAQVFVLPQQLDPTTVGSVAIYCKRFNVIFSVASLTAP